LHGSARLFVLDETRLA